MKSYQFKTETTEDTLKLAEKLAVLLRPGNVITLEGDLGAGKTTFTKGIGRGLGIKRTINSPTFTIVKEYMGKMPLYHMDVYRLEDSDEDIGFNEYFDGPGVSIVEWASFIKDFLPDNRMDITLERVNEETRRITFNPRGKDFEKICEELVR